MGIEKDISIQMVKCFQLSLEKKCLKMDYQPPEGTSAEHWAGFYFQYPENNWGEFPGRNLSGATKVSFLAKSEPPMTVEFISGGNRDSFKKSLIVELKSEWSNYDISLMGADLRSVIGPLAVIVSKGKGGKRGSIFIDDVKVDRSLLNEPRFMQSFVPNGCITGAPDSVSNVYDQSLVLLAFLARGTPEDIRRAELIAQALTQAQNNDRTFKDGRLRNAYANGPLLDVSTGKTRLPGQWKQEWGGGVGKFIEDEFSAGSDTGNAAWAALALIQAHKLLHKRNEEKTYMKAALKLGEWIVRENRVENSPGGFRGGYEDFEPTETRLKGQFRSTWRSTEHNIDLVALFGHLATAVGRETKEGQKWLEQQAHARNFVEAMINKAEGYLWTGTQIGNDKWNEVAVPLDTQTWSVLGMEQPERYKAALDWAVQHCGAGNEFPHAFDFNCNDGDGAWWEGTAQMATALNVLGRENEAKLVIAQLQKVQITEGSAAGALPAATKCGLTTGFERFWHSYGQKKIWTYPNSPHIGATAWYLFARLGKNPYNLSADKRGKI